MNYYNNCSSHIPNEEDILEWLKITYNYISKTFNMNNSIEPFDVIRDNGLLCYDRCYIDPKDVFIEDDKSVGVIVSQKNQKMLAEMNISPSFALKINSVKCSRCGINYYDCNCINFIDDCHEIIEEGELFSYIWTDRNAYNIKKINIKN